MDLAVEMDSVHLVRARERNVKDNSQVPDLDRRVENVGKASSLSQRPKGWIGRDWKSNALIWEQMTTRACEPSQRRSWFQHSEHEYAFDLGGSWGKGFIPSYVSRHGSTVDYRPPLARPAPFGLLASFLESFVIWDAWAGSWPFGGIWQIPTVSSSKPAIHWARAEAQASLEMEERTVKFSHWQGQKRESQGSNTSLTNKRHMWSLQQTSLPQITPTPWGAAEPSDWAAAVLKVLFKDSVFADPGLWA